MTECRAAILAGDYAAANELLAALRRQVEQAWPAADRERRQLIAGQVLGLLNWARHTALARRSHAQTRLHAVNRRSAYLLAPAPRRFAPDLNG